MVNHLSSELRFNTTNRTKPLRPIRTSIGSELYHTSKFLADILSALQNKNGLAVENSKELVRKITGIEIADDKVIVSLDVTYLPVHSNTSTESM